MKDLGHDDEEKIREIISDLVNEGVLYWGINKGQAGPPFFKISRMGKKVLEHGYPQPYDPDGYLKGLKQEIPNLDGLVEAYLAESLQAYLRGLMLASSVMLGVASERMFNILVEVFTAAIEDDGEKAQFKKSLKGKRLKQRFDKFKSVTNRYKKGKDFPQELREDWETQLEFIFTIIRNCRNDSGHPTGKIISRGRVFNNLVLFSDYCKSIYRTIDYFEGNKVRI